MILIDNSSRRIISIIDNSLSFSFYFAISLQYHHLCIRILAPMKKVDSYATIHPKEVLAKELKEKGIAQKVFASAVEGNGNSSKSLVHQLVHMH